MRPTRVSISVRYDPPEGAGGSVVRIPESTDGSERPSALWPHRSTRRSSREDDHLRRGRLALTFTLTHAFAPGGVRIDEVAGILPVTHSVPESPLTRSQQSPSGPISICLLAAAVLSLARCESAAETQPEGAPSPQEDGRLINTLSIECAEWNTTVFYYFATPEMIAACLSGGAGVSVRDGEGKTPLHHAARDAADPNVLRSLVLAGAEVNSTDDSGSNPLYWAAWNNPNPSVIEYLVRAGANLMARGALGDTALHRAVAGNLDGPEPEVVAVLVELGADPNARDEDGQSPLHISMTRDIDLVVIETLVLGGADLRAKDNKGRTPLHSVVSCQAFASDRIRGDTPTRRDLRVSAMDILIRAGAEVDARDAEGMTPLHHAGACGSDPVPLEVLLVAGADPVARDAKGFFPLTRMSARLRETRVGRFLDEAILRSLR